jgi:hypothetical protein
MKTAADAITFLGPKYSSNLRRSLDKIARKGVEHLDRQRVFRGVAGFGGEDIYVGYLFDRDFIGTRLSNMITNSFRSGYGGPYSYKDQGLKVCLLDKSHSFYPERWATKTRTRTCKYCGLKQKLKKVKKVVVTEKWEKV